MTSAPIVLVPGFWLGAWAWDEVAAVLRADGHDVMALTLPGLELVDADRSAVTLSDHVDAICEAVRAASAPVVLAVHSGAGYAGYAASDRIPQRIAAMVYVDSAPGIGASAPDFDGVEKPLPARGAREGGEPRRAQRGAARDVPAAGGAAAGWRPARGRDADERCARRYSDDGRLHRVHVRAGPGRREGGPCVAPGPRRAAGRHLGRPADQPLADVVASPRARRDHRGRREGARRRRPMTAPLLGDAFAHHVWARWARMGPSR